MQYRLKFIDPVEQTVRELKVDTDGDDTAIAYSSKQSICFDMPVELWREDELVVRTTPLTALLYLADGEATARP